MSASSSIEMHGDCWEGVVSHDWHCENPSEQEFLQALLRLDAERYTIVSLAGSESSQLSIGGGGGRYVVYATFDNWDFWNLICQNPGVEMAMLKAGGQEGDFPARQVVGIDQARDAGLFFLRARELDPLQLWERQ